MEIYLTKKQRKKNKKKTLIKQKGHFILVQRFIGNLSRMSALIDDFTLRKIP